MNLGPAGKLAHYFINSKLTPLFIIASIILGTGATIFLPREEEPQIKVPMIDVFVQMPGASSKEIEQRITTPMEKLIMEIPGVEYVYTTSKPSMSMAIVRFKVGMDEEKSIVDLNQKLYANFDLIPPGASLPLIKPRSIDDVPILAVTFWSDNYDHYTLRRVASEVQNEIKHIPDVSEINLIGGTKRELRVEYDINKLKSYNMAPGTLIDIIKKSNQQYNIGSFSSNSKEIFVDTNGFFKNKEDLESLVIGVYNGVPVYLKDIANIIDGPEESSNYVFFGIGKSSHEKMISKNYSTGETYPAVTLSIAKRKGTNAIEVANQVLKKIELIKGTIIPHDIQATVTKNYGETAKEKSDELLLHMAIAIISVTILIMFALGLRESITVAVAIPVTLALTLMVFYLYGYTLNRITLFALIFSIGILVDDAIVIVENLVRHYHLPENKNKSLSEIAIEAVSEVGNPTILATLAVIGAILPMAFVRGLMGPYMRPIPVGASAAMVFSLIVAFIVTPWVAIRILKLSGGAAAHDTHEDWTTKLYRKFMGFLINSKAGRNIFLMSVLILLIMAMALVPLKKVIVKMLPFDNKSEFQVIVNMPEDTPLEKTAQVLQELGSYLAKVKEVTDYQTYAGIASPYNFNGLVRHYFLRSGNAVGDIQVNLVPKDKRDRQSHEIVKSVRDDLTKIGQKYGAVIQLAEVPPGPPVLQTLVVEVYGEDANERISFAKRIKTIFEETQGVVDVDIYQERDITKVTFDVDKRKAILTGIDMEQINTTLSIAIHGLNVGLIHDENEKEDLNINLRVPREKRSNIRDFSSIYVMGNQGNLVSLSELITPREEPVDKSIYHKNGMPVIYVVGDLAGKQESPVYAIIKMMDDIDKLKDKDGNKINQYSASLPYFENTMSVKWDGEWHITYEVFRDLGIAFAVVLLLIYILVVGWFQSFKIPVTIMAAIPFSLVGILPAHYLMGAFFTATSMIGFIAGAGIVVRNSIILVDFIELRLSHNVRLEEAVIDAGAVRFRPMLLTAAAVIVGASVILFDPIFQGLAISLMAGEVASLLLSRMTVPVLYYISKKKGTDKN